MFNFLNSSPRLGLETSQDEAGTAAYKTVELDDFLNGAAVQYREVEGYESAEFLKIFESTGGIKILEGGMESGFNHVKPVEYRPRLLEVKGKHHIRIQQVELTCDRFLLFRAFLVLTLCSASTKMMSLFLTQD